MKNTTKKFSLALASVFALGIVGCGSPDSDRTPGSGPDSIIAPPADGTLAYPPVVEYNHFTPKTELELKATYTEGENKGKPIANYGYLIAKVRSGFDPAAFAKHDLEVRGSISTNGATYYRLYKESDLVETMKKVGRMNGLMYIEPELMGYTTGGMAYDNPDPYVSDQQQYGVLTTMTKKAWEIYGFGTNTPVVGHIDSGVRYRHSDLTNVVKHAFAWLDPDNLSENNPMKDPDPEDWRVTRPNDDGGTDPRHGHGTHTAGIMAAEGNNGVGVAGMCWNVDLVSYRAVNDWGSGNDWTIFGPLWHLARWKKTNYPHTIPVNMSVTSNVVSQFCIDMVETALEHDIVLICPSGNDASGIPSFPGSITGTIRVGAVNALDRRLYFSNWGQDLSVMAPGASVMSTAVDGGYAYDSGTSMAAPHVTGLVAYMLTFAPDLKPDQIRMYLEKNADPVEGQKGFDPHVGYGRINTYKTIGAVIADREAGTTPASNYALTPVKVTVKSKTTGAPINGATVFLHNSTQDGKITNYAGLSITGLSYVGTRDNQAASPENGVVWFNMLKPGFYKASVNCLTGDMITGETVATSAESQVFEVRRGVAVDHITITPDVPTLLHVQTYPTQNLSGSLDIKLGLYDSNGPLRELDWDYGRNELLSLFMPTPGPYWIRVWPWNGEWNENATGEYALWVGISLQPEPAPGTFDAPGPDGIEGSHAQTQSDAQLIKINDKVVYGNITSNSVRSGDWYKFVIE